MENGAAGNAQDDPDRQKLQGVAPATGAGLHSPRTEARVQNLHPLIVHFPIGLLFTSAVVALWAQATNRPGAHLVARVLLWLGTVAAAAAVISGFLGAQTVARVTGAHDVIEEHEKYAYVLLGLSCALSGWALIAYKRRHASPAPAVPWVIGQVLLLAMLVLTAKEGGELVHELGVGTKMTAPGGRLYEPSMQTARPDSTVPSSKDFR
jgi:uncharacterized membrane protein